jgi:hypothetical protein
MKTYPYKFLQKNYKSLLGSILVVVGFTLAIYLLLDVFEINDINPFFLLHLGFFALGSEVLGILFLSKIR